MSGLSYHDNQANAQQRILRRPAVCDYCSYECALQITTGVHSRRHSIPTTHRQDGRPGRGGSPTKRLTTRSLYEDDQLDAALVAPECRRTVRPSARPQTRPSDHVPDLRPGHRTTRPRRRLWIRSEYGHEQRLRPPQPEDETDLAGRGQRHCSTTASRAWGRNQDAFKRHCNRDEKAERTTR